MDSQIEMNKASLKKLSKSKLIKLLLDQKKRKPEIIIVDDTKPVPTQRPRQPPSLFGEVPEINVPILKPTVVTTTLNKLPNVIQKTTENVIDWEEWLKNADEAIKAINATKNERKNEIMNMFKPTFTQKEQAMRGFTRSYEIGLTNRQDPLIQLQNTRSVIKNNLSKVLNEMKGLKFNER